ncbi:MAG: aldehyde dehydrogenase family protein, partial [Mesorhizobium sp.]
MLPYVMKYNCAAAAAEMTEIGLALGLDGKDRSTAEMGDATIDEIGRLFAAIGITPTLARLGLPADKLDWTAEQAAARAADGWRTTAPRKRSEILRRCFELMTQRCETLATLISLENGKALRDARGEIAYAAEFFRWNAEEAVRITGEFGMAPSGTNRIVVDYEPIGICVLVTPWNFPAAMATRKIAPALAAGCTVILKPASETPLTAYALAALYQEAGVPPGVVNVLTTSNPGPVTAAMLA